MRTVIFAIVGMLATQTEAVKVTAEPCVNGVNAWGIPCFA